MDLEKEMSGERRQDGGEKEEGDNKQNRRYEHMANAEENTLRTKWSTSSRKSSPFSVSHQQRRSLLIPVTGTLE